MKTIKIGLSCTPSHRISSKEMKADKILFAEGKGIGSTTTTYYAKLVIYGKLFYLITLLDDRVIKINTSFIISIEKVNIVMVVNDITHHANYHSFTAKQVIETIYYDLGINSYQLIDDYKTEAKIAYSETINKTS